MASTQKTFARRIVGLLSLVLAATAWFFLAPQSIGGNVAYTVITGQSMEPGLRASDLVIVRERSSYEVGDVIAYRSRNLGQIVLHRAVGQEDGRFVMKGDNNDFLDADRPAGAEILGARWVHIPKAGAVFTFLRSTVGMALGAVGIFGILGVFSVKERRRRRRGRHRKEEIPRIETRGAPSASLEPVPATNAQGSRLRIAAVVVCAALVASVVATVAAFSRPLFRAETEDVDLVHRGRFSYSAPAPAGPVYQSTRVGAGDPVFVRLVRDLAVGFDYELDTEGERDLEVAASMDAVLRSDNGWTRSLALVPLENSTDGSVGLEGDLDLAEVRAMLGRVEGLTGMAPGTYSLSVEPRVSVDGTLEGEPVNDTFSPDLLFQLNDIQLGLVRPQEGGLRVGLDQILNPVEKSSVTVDRMVPDPFILGGRAVPVLAVRRAGLVAIALSLLALVALAVLWARRRPKDEATRIAARYSSLLIPVADAPELTQETVDVTTIETLVRLAQQFEQPIMHKQNPDGSHSYTLFYDGLLYRYRIEGDVAEIPVLRFEPPASSDRPVVRAVLTRPSRPEPDAAAGIDVSS